MASRQEFVQYSTDQLSGAGTITYRKMFGEYGIYCDGKFFALICNDQLFVKITEAGLAEEDGKSVGNITGTADSLPVKEQLEMIRAMMPEAKKIGILYTTSEANSISTIETYKALAGDFGFEIVDTGINTIADVEMAAKDMAAKVDCMTNLTDNTVVSALQTVLAAANAQGIPVFGSEIEQVKNGCLASMGIDYIALGKQTGAMAAKVLKGEAAAADLQVETCEGANLYVNTAVAENLEFPLDEEYISGAVETFKEITVE